MRPWGRKPHGTFALRALPTGCSCSRCTSVFHVLLCIRFRFVVQKHRKRLRLFCFLSHEGFLFVQLGPGGGRAGRTIRPRLGVRRNQDLWQRSVMCPLSTVDIPISTTWVYHVLPFEHRLFAMYQLSPVQLVRFETEMEMKIEFAVVGEISPSGLTPQPIRHEESLLGEMADA